MTVLSSDLVLFGAVSRPEDEVSLTGGAQDAAARPIDSPLASTQNIEFVSDGADVRTMSITYRDAAGDIQTFGPTALNGTTPVAGPTGVERIEKATLSAADGSRTVTLRVASAGATIHTFNPTETDTFRFFQRSSSSAAQETFYEKLFWENTNGATSLTAAEVTLTADPDTKFRIAVEATKDDSATVANRKTTPSGVTFVDDGVAAGVPSGSLAAGEAIGVWVEMVLAADAAAAKSTFTTELAGETT